MDTYMLEFYDQHGVRRVTVFENVDDLKLAIDECLRRRFNFLVDMYSIYEVK